MKKNISAASKNSLRALVAYLPDSVTLPINHPNFYGHSNYQECRTLVKSLTEKGFSCDVVDWQEDVRNLRGANYDLLIAVHDQLEYARSIVKKNGKVIFYSTHSHWMFSNFAEYNRLIQLKKRRGYSLIPRRLLTPINFEDNIDEIWYLGNSFQENTYSHIKVPKYRLNISVIDINSDYNKELSNKTKNNFLWFGSRGAVHKGLDWLLEIFTKNRNLHLHICGLVDQEKDFLEAYKNELFHKPNIHYHGWVSILYERFKQITDQCAFVIVPTCSEGGGGSILQCMQEGLIPIVTNSSTIDVGDYGFLIDESTLESTQKAIFSAFDTSLSLLNDMSKKSSSYVKNNHLLTYYEKEVRKRIRSLIKQM